MPRKATNVSSDIRKKSKAKGNKCNKEDKKLVKNIYIGASNAARWNILKNKLKYESDVELVQYLLNLAEPVLNRNDEDASVQGTVECEITSHEKPTSPEPEPELAKIQAIEIEQPAADQTHENLDTPTSNKVMKKFKHVQVEQAQNIQKSPNEHEETKVDSEINPKRKEDKKIKVKSNDQNEELSANADSNESGEVLPSEEDARDADWCPEGDAPLRRSPRKPGPRRSTRNHRHHRKRRHRRPSSPALQPPLREENHKHHHEKHKGCGSRGRKKRKHKDKQESGVVEEKSHVEEVVPSPPPPEPPTIEPSTLPSPSLSPIPTEPRHRRKHKRRDSKKRIHDIRRAPADGIPALEPPVSPVGATSVIQENVSSMTLPPPILELPPEPTVVSEITSCKNDELHMTQAPCLSPAPTTPQLLQRVAIRIKLCGDCGCRHVQDACPLLTPIMQVPDALTRSQWISNPRKGSNFTQESLPIDLFALEERDSSHGLSVIVCSPIERYTQFGPLLGARIKQMDIPDDFHMRDIWEIKGLGERYYLSTTDFEQANWLRFIRPAPTKEQRNVAAVTRSNELYFVTLCALEPGAELLYWHEHSASGWARKKMEKTNCGGCNLRFGHSLYYRLHCSVFHDPSFSLTIRKYHCKVCGLAVLGKENIMRHAAEQHNGKGAYQCQFCKKFFLRLNYLEMHRTYGCAANPQRTRPLCDFCGRKFCQPQKLKVHIKRMHSDMAEVLREFQCKMCLKLLGSRAALQRHLKEVHHKDLVGACTCDRCGKMFQNKSNLKIHMLTHSGVKPFRCTEGSCNAAFTTKQCLQFHYKKVHGFTEESMPKIERCVAYTFDAYAGSNDNTSTSNNPSNPSPPFTPAGTEEASPAPSLPSLEDDDEEMSSCSPQPQRDIADHVDTSASSEHMPVCSPTPPPPILRAVSPVELPTICTRPTTILSKASKKWMGDVEITQPTMQPSKKWINELEPSPAPTMQEISKQRWSNEPPLQEPALDVATKRWVECSQPESPEHVDKKWALECNLPTMRSPDLRRPELSFTRTLVRPQVLDQDLMTEQTRGCSPLGGDFSPLRRTEPSASLLVEAALDAAERDLTGKLADLKPPTYMQQPRLNGNDVSEADYMSVACAKPSRLGVQTETGLDMSYKQYDTSELVNTELSNTEFRVMRSPEQVCSFEQEQGLDMSRTSSYANSAGYSRYSHSELQIPPHLHAHHRAAVAAAGLMYEMEPVRSPPPVSPPAYQTELLRHHWHHSHHTLDLSTARGQQSPEQSMSPPPQSYQNYPPSPYHAPPPRAPTPPYHHYSGYY